MTQFKMKRVYEEASDTDGFRIFVDRLWPRGIKKENFYYDLWEKEITPSTELRKWYHQDPENNWKGFVNKYQKELAENEAIKELVKTIKEKKTVTLLYASKDKVHNHAMILKEVLEKETEKF